MLDAVPHVDLHGLVARAEADGDPFAGRRDPSSASACVLQAGDRLPLYLALAPGDMAGAARALAASWRLYGIGSGDVVLIYDYGTSPATLFASWSYVPGLRAGAADLLGAVPICNDGLAEFAPRALHVLRYLRPRAVFVDAEVMPVFVRRAAEARFDVGEHTRMIIVSADEEAARPGDLAAWSAALGVPVRSMLRSDPALFFAGQCEAGVFHADAASYAVEVVPGDGGAGRLCVTNFFLTATPVIRHVTDIVATVDASPCRCGAPGVVMRTS
jgi:phenylacetate-coenzyme A ligase PaaK-like adenylate-forming protein